ncbi:Lar family restriction alleviation protein [Salipiger bermudensis]|uniref:Lar family restriction alleviation protein n=1 Tax=Salipiger bermudensis TaxID=344736 RepID=UPI001C9A2652|nr:Lar family restriction alleviation protein [Salipiger bermudensis]MBY6005413.1 Lar family restriction alleviation protein [Salipiger bermudensis]
MTEAPKLKPCPFCGASDPSDVYVDRLQSDGRRWAVLCTATDCLVEGPHRATKREAIAAWNTRDDAEVQRLVAEARAEAIAEILRIVTAYRKEAGQRADGKTFQALDDLRWDLRDLADQSNDAPPRQVTPQEADVSAAYLLEWMTYHHLPLQLWQEDDGSWVIVDNSTGSVLGSGETAEIALRAALRALANGGEG